MHTARIWGLFRVIAPCDACHVGNFRPIFRNQSGPMMGNNSRTIGKRMHSHLISRQRLCEISDLSSMRLHQSEEPPTQRSYISEPYAAAVISSGTSGVACGLVACHLRAKEGLAVQSSDLRSEPKGPRNRDQSRIKEVTAKRQNDSCSTC